MARLKDIAKEAGVSIPTVSLILSGKTQEFNPDTCRRVQRVADKLNYRPNIAARSLQQQKSFLIGVLISDVNALSMSTLLRGVFNALGDTDYSPIVLSHTDKAEESRCLHRCLERQVDGLIANVAVDADGMTDTSGYLEAIANGVPVAEIFGRFLVGAPSVNVDFRAAGREAARHLIGRGHRSIAMLTHEHYDDARTDKTGHSYDAWERYEGYRQELAEARLDPLVVTHPLPSDIDNVQQFLQGGTEALGRILSERATPTGVVCYNDFEAYGLLEACRLHGINVPRDLSIVGYGDFEVTRIANPGITTLRVPAGNVGLEAIATLMAMIDGNAPESSLLPSELVVRKSTGPARS